MTFPVAPIDAIPSMPLWVRSRLDEQSDADVAYRCGAALNCLDNLVRSAPVWAGVWRHRLALSAAAAAMPLIGRREDQAGLRDALLLRAPGDDAGPGGRVLLAWRRLASRPRNLEPDAVRKAAELFGLNWDHALEAVLGNVAELTRSNRPAPLVAAETATIIFTARPDAEMLALWLADAMLAHKMRWPIAVPLLLNGQARRRIRPGAAGWGRAVMLAYAEAAIAVCDLGADLAPRAEKLLSVTPKLRANSAELVALLLADDAVAGTWSSPKLSDRGTRRVFDRLMKFDAVRELSGRSTFRLYGL